MLSRWIRQFRYLSLLITSFLLAGCKSVEGVLNPKGVITFEERQLLFDSLALMLIVVIPVIIMSFAFLFRYRESNKTADYSPNWCHSTVLESIWWGVPMGIILILGIMTWTTTHELDPYREIAVPGEPLQVNVVALPWKWLFIYPEQNIATVNHLTLPKGRQVRFHLTTDNVPMSAFFIPQIGSQIYTMAGMRTKLHLIPTHLGTYRGLNSQYNGDGFSDMNFEVNVINKTDLNSWFDKIRASGAQPLSRAAYKVLRQPTIAAAPQTFAGVEKDLFKSIIKSYHAPHHPE